MNKRPLVVICIFFILGIILTRFLSDSVRFLHIFIGTLIFIVLSFIFSRYQKISNIFLLLSITSFASLLYINSNIFPKGHISHFLGEEKLKTDIVGIIKSPALTRKPYYGKINSTYLFEVEGMKDNDEWLELQGLAQIRIQTEKDYEYGDRLMVRGTIRRPYSVAAASYAANMNKGRHKMAQLQEHKKKSFNYREYLERQNIFALVNTKEANVTILAHNYKSNPILKYTYILREKLKNRIIDKIPLESGAFLRAILLGDRSELHKDIQIAFKNSGTMHILAISGLHVGLIAIVIMFLLKALMLKREVYYVLTMVFLVFFAMFVLSTPSVVRAVVMTCLFLAGRLLGRKVDVYNILGAAAIFILAVNPKDFFNVGFQLSFLAVLSIMYFAPKIMKLIKENTNFYLKKYLYMPMAVSTSAWIGTFPLILYYFRMITPVSIIANLFILPVLFLLLIGGIAFLMLGWVPSIGVFLAGYCNFLSNILFFLTGFFASLKFGHFSFSQ